MEKSRPRWHTSNPETLRTLQRLNDFRRNNPEAFKLSLSKHKKEIDHRRKMKLFTQRPDFKQIRRASRLAWLEKIGQPDMFGYQPCGIRDTSAATCYTKEEDDMYKKYAVEHPLERVFKVINPTTARPDEVYTACVIERYREYHSAKRNEPLLKRHRTEEKGESTETVVPASYGHVASTGSNETVVDDASGNN